MNLQFPAAELLASKCNKSLTIDFDTAYGIDKRTGWSIAINGCYVVQFADSLGEALRAAYDYLNERDDSDATR